MPQNMNEYSCDDVKPRESDEIVSYRFTENFSVEINSESI